MHDITHEHKLLAAEGVARDMMTEARLLREQIDDLKDENRQLRRRRRNKAASENRRKSDVPDQVGVFVSEVKRERLRWLWKGRLALGKITILDGDPGLGKSTLYCDIATRITTGRGWPDDGAFYGVEQTRGPEHAGTVIIVTCEDSISDTIRPRLEEANADLSHCLVIQTIPETDEETGERVDRPAVLPDHLPEIEEAIRRTKACLLIIDPFFAHLSSDLNSFKDQDVRKALAALAVLAENHGVAVLIVRHLNKMAGGSVLYRGGGSIGIIGAARLGLLLGRNPDDEEALVLAVSKSNIAKPAPSLALRVVSSPGDPEVGIIQWEGTSPYDAQDLVSGSTRERSDAQSVAECWLLEKLRDCNPHRALHLLTAAAADGVKERTVRRAKKSLGVVAERIGGVAGDGAWYWTLPEEARDQALRRLRLPIHDDGSLSKGTRNES